MIDGVYLGVLSNRSHEKKITILPLVGFLMSLALGLPFHALLFADSITPRYLPVTNLPSVLPSVPFYSVSTNLPPASQVIPSYPLSPNFPSAPQNPGRYSQFASIGGAFQGAPVYQQTPSIGGISQGPSYSQAPNIGGVARSEPLYSQTAGVANALSPKLPKSGGGGRAENRAVVSTYLPLSWQSSNLLLPSALLALLLFIFFSRFVSHFFEKKKRGIDVISNLAHY